MTYCDNCKYAKTKEKCQGCLRIEDLIDEEGNFEEEYNYQNYEPKEVDE